MVLRLKIKKPPVCHLGVGVGLLSQGLAPQVSSTLAGLTALFGMGRGVPPPLKTPTQKRQNRRFCKNILPDFCLFFKEKLTLAE
jgi:hypothetical protein